jgi:hypothetical protein
MATYMTRQMRDGRIDLFKPYSEDITIKLYPQKNDEGYYPHIYFKGRLNELGRSLCKGMKITEHYMKEPKGFTQISFGKVTDFKQALSDMQSLGMLVAPLKHLSK